MLRHPQPPTMKASQGFTFWKVQYIKVPFALERPPPSPILIMEGNKIPHLKEGERERARKEAERGERECDKKSKMGRVREGGQVEVHAVLQVPDLDPEPEQTEFYVVLEGSRLSHVTVAKRAEDGESLCFTVPGHDLQETASVTVYRHTEGGAKPCGGGASLKYVRDLPQEVAEYLLANSDCLSPQSHLEVLRRVSAAPGEGDREGNRRSCPGEEHYLGQTDQEEEGGRGGRPRPDPQVECRLREMDERITQAMANMDYPPEWSGKASQPREGLEEYLVLVVCAS
ncbi:unnamed protein product [Coregonus sp. 'balchen']|nr:unnamed protein product [Coregonus sp. 'balchen']